MFYLFYFVVVITNNQNTKTDLSKFRFETNKQEKIEANNLISTYSLSALSTIVLFCLTENKKR